MNKLFVPHMAVCRAVIRVWGGPRQVVRLLPGVWSATGSANAGYVVDPARFPLRTEAAGGGAVIGDVVYLLVDGKVAAYYDRYDGGRGPVLTLRPGSVVEEHPGHPILAYEQEAAWSLLAYYHPAVLEAEVRLGLRPRPFPRERVVEALLRNYPEMLLPGDLVIARRVASDLRAQRDPESSRIREAIRRLESRLRPRPAVAGPLAAAA